MSRNQGNARTLMKFFKKSSVILLLLAITSLLVISGWAQNKSVKYMTDEELKMSIDSLVADELPLSAEPLFAEAKSRAAKAEDTRWMLDLISKEISLNARRRIRETTAKDEYSKARETAWTPLRQMLSLTLYVTNSNDDDALAAMESPAELRKFKVKDVSDEVDVADMNLFDYIGLSIVMRNQFVTRELSNEQQLAVFESSPKDFAASDIKMPLGVEVLRRMTAEALSAGDNQSLVLAQALRVLLATSSLAVDRESLMADLYAMKASDDLSKALIKVVKAAEFIDSAKMLGAENIEEAEAKIEEALALYKAVLKSKVCSVVKEQCTLRVNAIKDTVMSVEAPKQVMPGKYVPLCLTYRNVDKVTISLHRTDSSSQDIKRKISLPKTNNRLLDSKAYIELDGLDCGYYNVSVSVDRKAKPLAVTTLLCSALSPTVVITGKSNHAVISDFDTGKPVADAFVNGQSKPDKDGWVDLSKSLSKSNGKVDIKRGDDCFSSEFWSYGDGLQKKHKPDIQVITDRCIYRPGQKVLFKAYLYERYIDHLTPSSKGSECKAKLVGANGKTLSTCKLKLDEFGTASGELNVPADAMRGGAYIAFDGFGARSHIAIEDFKRTDNTVSFDDFADVILPGSEAVVSGKCISAAGLPVANAVVAYEVSQYGEKSVVTGEVMTDSNGAFSFSFNAKKEGAYSIEARVTDSRGETAEKHTSFHVSSAGYRIGLNLEQEIGDAAQGPQIRLSSLNSNDCPYASKVHLTVTPYEPTTLRPVVFDSPMDTVIGNKCHVAFGQPDFYSNKPCKEASPVFEADYDVYGVKKLDLASLNLTPRRYNIKVTALALDSTELRIESDYVAMAAEGRQEGLDYLSILSPDFAECGKDFQFRVGTGLDDARVSVVVSYRDKIVLRKHLDMSHGVESLSCPVPDDAVDGEKLIIGVFTTKEGKAYDKTAEVAVKKVDKEIKLSLSTFRDYSRPGAQEKWTLRYTGGGESTIAASMYDSRLDKYVDNEWRSRFSRLKVANRLKISPLGPTIRNSSYSCSGHYRWVDSGALEDILDAFSFEEERYVDYDMEPLFGCAVGSSPRMLNKSMAVSNSKMVVEGATMFDSAEDLVAESDGDGITFGEPIREDFSETVFFLPDLRPDANGDATFEFTLPDNITTYNFRALAIDRQMRYAHVTSALTVRKPLNVRLGLPRFVTEGDTVTIPVDVTAADSTITSANVSLKISDASTDRILYLQPSQSVDFNGAMSGSAQWVFVVPENVDTLNVEVTGAAMSQGAETGDKDGERISVPVTKANIEVEESHSFVLTGKGDHNVLNPFTEGRTKLLSFDYTSNAFIEVLRALPSLDKSWYPCADTYLGRYESAAIASLLKQKDDVKSAVAYLKKNEGSLSTIDDADHTPWYLMAQRLAKHDKDVVRLMSGNYANATKRDNLCKLQNMQLSDGSFPWFAGMEGSDWMTVSVTTTLCEMIQLGLVDQDDMSTVSKILTKARPRIDTILAKQLAEYEKRQGELSEADKAHHYHSLLPTFALEALQASVFMNAKVDGSAAKLVDVIKENWHYPVMCDRVTVVSILTQVGEREKAMSIVKSLEENLVQTKDGTAYIAETNAFRRREQVEAQAMLIFALQRLNPDSKNLQRIVNHLVLMKRGEAWPDAQSTGRAVLALLGSSVTGSETDVVEVADQSVVCTVHSPEFHMALPTDGSVTEASVTKSGNTASWGSWNRILQSPIDKLKADGTDKLKINRSVKVRRMVDGREEWQSVDDVATSLQIGDKVLVTLTFYNDEALSFVRIRDHRASAVEPDDKLSGYRGWWFWRWSDADIPTPCHYLQISDETTDFFIDYLYEGWHSVSYTSTVTHSGDFAGGYADAVCMYATEIKAHTDGGRISVSARK